VSQLVRHWRQRPELGRPLHGPRTASTADQRAFKVMSVAQSHCTATIHSEQVSARVRNRLLRTRNARRHHLKNLDEREGANHDSSATARPLRDRRQGRPRSNPLETQRRAGAHRASEFISEHLRRQGYQQVFTPHIGRLELYKTRATISYYRTPQFPR